MNTSVGRPEIGQWYARADKGELFQVVGRDEQSRAIEIQTIDGEVDEIDSETWATLPLERSEPPEDWTAPMDDIESDDLGYSDTGMAPADWARPLQPLQPEGDVWQEPEPEEEREAPGEDRPAEPLSADVPAADRLPRP